WDNELPIIAFIGLNPSIANESENDPTMTRVCRFAKDWGYGGVYMFNLFTNIDTKNIELKNHRWADYWLRNIGIKAKEIVFAWGADKRARERAKQVIEWFPEATCLK